MVKNGKPQVDKDGNPVTTPNPRYFQSRPSATVPPYNAAASTFSNLGPNDVATEQSIAANMKAYLALEKPYDPEPDGLEGSGRRGQHHRLGCRSGHLAGQRRHPGAPDRRGPASADVAR